MPQPPEVDALGEPLRSAYANAWERIVAEQQAIADDPVREARRFRLAEVRARVEEQLDDLEKISSDWVANQFPKAYMLGGQAAAADAGGGGVGQFVWSQINEEAVQRLATGLYQDLLKATDGVRESTKELIRAISKDESLQALIEGRTAKQAGVEMRRLLEEKGISAVTYADKSRHGLREYAEMAQRTQTAIAYNEGSINQWAQSDVKYVEVFDGPTCGWTFHNDTTLASGLIVTLDEARAWPISHPNCRRGFGARPDIRTPKDARDAQGGQVTDSQMESQRAADRAQPGTKGQRYTQEQIARGQYEAPPHPNASAAEKQLANREAKLAERTAPVSQPMAAPDEGYQMLHQAAGREGSPLSDLTTGAEGGIYPADFYDKATQLDYYGTGDLVADKESLAVINKVRGKPDEMVTVYRAVPDGVTTVNQGDWVTLSPSYAEGHLAGPLNGSGHVISEQVRAGDLFTSGDSINEFGWAVDELPLSQPMMAPSPPTRRAYTKAEADEINRLQAELKPYRLQLQEFHRRELLANDDVFLDMPYEEVLRLQKIKAEEQALVKRIFEARYLGDASMDTAESAAYWADVAASQKVVIVPPKSKVNPERWAKARESYVGQDGKTRAMNAAMRAEDVSPAIQRQINDAMHMTAGTLRDDVVLSRSIVLKPGEASRLQVGDTLENLAFQSTEANASGLGSQYNRTGDYYNRVNVVIEMRVPAGTHAADVFDSEIVLRPGNVRVVSQRWDGDSYHLVTEWIPPGGSPSLPMMQADLLNKPKTLAIGGDIPGYNVVDTFGGYKGQRQAALDQLNLGELDEAFIAHQRKQTGTAMSSANGSIVKGSESTILKPDGTELHFSEFGSRMNEGEWYPGFGLQPDAATGYVMPRSWLIKQNDVVYMFEVEPHGLLSEKMVTAFQQQIDQHIESLKALPKAMTENSTAVAFARGPNPQDAVFQKQFKKPKFVSESTACEGTITVWGGRTLRPEARLHELGHMADTIDGTGARLSQSKPWAEAVEADRKTSQLYEGSKKPANASGHELLPGSTSVSVYGKVSPEEDFAESVRVFFQDRDAGFAGIAPDGTQFRFADAWPERAKLLEEHFYGKPLPSKKPVPSKKALASKPVSSKPLSSNLPSNTTDSYKEVVDHFGNLFDSMAFKDADNFLDIPSIAAAGDIGLLEMIPGIPEYLNALADVSPLSPKEIKDALADAMQYWNYSPGKKPNSSMLFDFDDLIASAEDGAISVMDEFTVLADPIAVKEVLDPPLGHWLQAADEDSFDVTMMPYPVTEVKAIYNHQLHTALKAGDKKTVKALLDKPESVQALTDHLSVYASAHAGDVDSYVDAEVWAEEVADFEASFMAMVKAESVPGGPDSIYDSATDLIEDYLSDPTNAPESLNLYKDALASKQGWVIQQQKNTMLKTEIPSKPSAALPSKPSAPLVGTALEGLTEKQAALVNLMQQWEDSGVDVEAMSHFQIMGKMSNQPALKGLKKVDALAAQNAHIATKGGAQAQAALIDSLTPLQRLYLQISQDWKATQGYDSLDNSINSIMGKLHKYPEIKGIKKADVLAVHAAMAPGAHATASVAATIERATVDAAERASRSTGEMTTFAKASHSRAAGHIRTAGKGYEEFPMSDGTSPLARVRKWNRAEKAKHQVVGSISDAMADDEEIWEAFRALKAGDTFGAGGSRNVTHRGVTIGPFASHTREERYKMLYDTNNKMIQGWAGTSGNDHIYALAMQQAAKDEFGLTGAVHSRAAGNIESLTQTFEGSPVSEAATKQLAALRAAYEKDGDYLRRFLRYQYQVTQDAFAAQGITHVSVYRGMNFSTISEPEWAGRFYDRADEVAAAHSKGPNITTAADRQRLDAIKTAPRPLMLQPMNSWSTSPRTARNFGDTIFKMEIPVDRVIGSAATGFGCLNETEFVIFDSAGLADLYMHRGAIVENMAKT